MSERPIGIFDSGVGGTSIYKEIRKVLPNEHIIYLADSKNAPYGGKTAEEITILSIKNCEFLIEKNCKIIVVACNTATTNSIVKLRNIYKFPIIGIEPAIKPAALNTRTKSIGILATKGTLSSLLFHQTSILYNGEINVIEQVGEGIVQLIEDGKINSLEMRNLLKKHLQPMLAKNIDYLVLGCTHYPYLIPILKDLLPANVIILDSGKAVAKQTIAILNDNNLYSKSTINGTSKFYTNGNLNVLRELLAKENNIEKMDF